MKNRRCLCSTLIQWGLEEDTERADRRAAAAAGDRGAAGGYRGVPPAGSGSRGAPAARRAPQQTGHLLRVVRKTLTAAAILVSLLFCVLMANASVRAAVVNTIIEWTGRDIGIRFEVTGEPLAALPNGYGPHYVPAGLIFDEEMSYQETDGSFFYTYASVDGKVILDVQVTIAQNGSAYWIDNEHLEHERITFNGVTAYYGHGTSVAAMKSAPCSGLKMESSMIFIRTSVCRSCLKLRKTFIKQEASVRISHRTPAFCHKNKS